MGVTIEKPKNPNYAACIVKLKDFSPIKGSDFIKVAHIYGNSVIVGIGANEGDRYIYFPVECAIDPRFLSENNLYRKAEFGNKDPLAKPGFFEQHGRVKAMILRKTKSEGFACPVPFLDYTGINADDIPDGVDFDKLGEFEICRKYVPRRNQGKSNGYTQTRKKHIEDRIVEDQFRFHYDTENLRRNMHQLNASDVVSITTKLHGTSACFANVLVEKELNWFERLLRRFGVPIQESKYGFVWSSRKVVKGIDGQEKEGSVHYYGEDVWGAVAKVIEPMLPKGYTVYGEIVGYTPSGAAIQSMAGKPYSYGCAPGQHDFYVYRVTSTNADGSVIELSWPQLKQFCEESGLKHVPELCYGEIETYVWYDFRDEMPREDGIVETFVEMIEERHVQEKECPLCKSGVPLEGIVVRVDGLHRSKAFKLKSGLFLRGESSDLDGGVIDIETWESHEEDTAIPE